ncbi:MAG TPA: HEAT repeat domain-containing protein, partial [Candidatus Ozemobacteraceae bacterium]|nr:HEAT repeat domain-containing protein [Candidatus Ozemobacteraceae bacterium]
MPDENELRKRGLVLIKPCTRKLIGFLHHQDAHIREEAARALGSIGDPEAVVPLVDALSRQPRDESLSGALAEIGDPSAVEPL